MGSDHFLNLQPGTIVNGRYEVVKCLGTGSMGMVYACRHRELAGHIVAMKVLFAEVARDEVAAARFRNEIVSSYGVSHPNVVRAYEYFRDGDLIAFTMEYIGGGDLADRINCEDLIAIDEIVSMLCQMSSGVQAIHDAGIIHRDLKPENILISPQGNVKITDFGIARTGTGPKLTEHGGVVGTIDYVSPEYLERGQVDARSDIYAMGVMAYEMITGEAPYKGKSVIETMTMRLRSDPDPPHHVRHDTPVGLSNIVLKMMRRDPEKRYQSAREILRDLNALKAAGEVPIRNAGGPGAKNSTRALTQKLDEFASSSSLLAAPETALKRPAGSAPGGGGSVAVNVGHGGYAAGGGFAGVAAEPIIGTTKDGGTLELEAKAAGQFRESVAEELSEYDTGFTDQAIDELLEERSYHGDRAADVSPSVAISNSRLSTQRIKELSAGVYQDAPSWNQTAFVLVFMFLVGFGLGLFILTHYFPELLAPKPEIESTEF